jgi:hypothetical protein
MRAIRLQILTQYKRKFGQFVQTVPRRNKSIEHPHMEEPVQDIRPDWLRGLAEKTWNMELIISGAATYLTSFLPELTDQAFYYMLDNYLPSNEMKRIDTPVLAYCFIKMVAYLLPTTFVVHFVLRAFWASLVGVHTVYPQGIQYDNLHGQKAVSRKLQRERYGRFSDYILRMDRMCNQVFGFAFSIALFGFGLGMVYLLIFGISFIIKYFFPNYHSQVAMVFFCVLGFVPLASQALLSTLPEEKYPKTHKVLGNILVNLPKFLFPFVYKPFNYLYLALSSNTSKWRFYTVFIGIFIVIMLGVLFVLTQTIASLRQYDQPIAAQSFLGIYQNQFLARPEAYEDQMPDKARLNSIVLPSELISGPLMKVFIPYPKRWDEALSRYCTVPKYDRDSMPKLRRRFLEDSSKVACLAQHLRLQVNDSMYKENEWVFQRHKVTGTYGLITYVPTQGFKVGKNALRATLTSETKADSTEVLGEVPFWFAKE